MDEALRQAYRRTDYLVCVDVVEWACIRIDQPLPPSLQRQAGARSWGAITACNPGSESCPPAENMAAQRTLLAALRTVQKTVIFPAIGIGADGWREPSFFVVGVDQAALDALGHRHRQNAYVFGQAGEPARLRWLRD